MSKESDKKAAADAAARLAAARLADEQAAAAKLADEQAAAAAKATPKIVVRAVYGEMIDPFTNEHFSQGGRPVTEITGWMMAQRDAGKMVFEE